MADPQVSHPQWFPAYYPASGRFKDDAGQDSGARGTKTILTFDFPTRPHALIGLRIENVWSLDNVQAIAADIGADVLAEIRAYAQQINAAQSVETRFTQSDIVIKPALQRTVIGGGDPPNVVHWHPFVCPYYLRGGNKVTVTVERLVSYPVITLADETQIPIIPTVHATWETIVGVEGASFGGRDWGSPTFGMMPGQDPAMGTR